MGCGLGVISCSDVCCTGWQGHTCTAFTECDSIETFESVRPTPTSDRRCTPYVAAIILTRCPYASITRASAATILTLEPIILKKLPVRPYAWAWYLLLKYKFTRYTTCGDLRYETTKPALTSDRACALLTVCEADNEFISTPSTATSDRTCQAFSAECKPDEFESAVPTPVSDRVCQQCARCLFGDYIESLCDKVSDTICLRCDVCKNGGECDKGADARWLHADPC